MKKDDWQLLGAIAGLVGAVIVIHGVTSKQWSDAHTVATIVSAAAAVGPYL